MEKFEGYTEEEIKTLEKANLYGKMADDLRAQAAQSRYRREHPETKLNTPPEREE